MPETKAVEDLRGGEVNTALISAAYLLLRVVGRWVLRRLSEKGRAWILRHMGKKIRKFRRQALELWDAGKKVRSRWRAGRAHRWSAARAWVRRHWYRLTRKGAEKLENVIRDRIPWQVHDFEDFDTWDKTDEAKQVREALEAA